MTRDCVVAAGNAGVDMLGGIPTTMLCDLPAGTPDLGEEFLRRLRSEDFAVGGASSGPSWAGDVGRARKGKPLPV